MGKGTTGMAEGTSGKTMGLAARHNNSECNDRKTNTIMKSIIPGSQAFMVCRDREVNQGRTK